MTTKLESRLDMLADIYGENEIMAIFRELTEGRDIALDGAISVCREIAKTDGSAAQCVKVLERIQFKLAHGCDAKPQ
jgi:hypothetical protein